MIGSRIIASSGGSSSGGGTSTGTQSFNVTNPLGETAFTITNYTLTDNYKVYVDGVRQEFGHSRAGNVVTFVATQPQFTVIVIDN